MMIETEVFPEVPDVTCHCRNPFCPDVDLPRVVGAADTYWCGTCGSQMAPPGEDDA